MTETPLMVGLGEVLWDVLPSGRFLGGAPANFAYMASVLGDRGVVASRVGSDQLGEEARKQLERLGLSTEYLQRDPEYRTGTAHVSIDSFGQPSFTIEESVAWDCLQWTPGWEELSARADVVCFGSLAQRAPVSFATIDRFLGNAKPGALRIFDVNLRGSYYCADVLRRSIEHADVVKLTDEELSVVASMLQLGEADDAQVTQRLLMDFELKLVCLTLGARGSVLVSRNERVCHGGFSVRVVDSIGAGDAFTACLAHHFLRGHSLAEISHYANRFASWVATQAGATPSVQPQQVHDLLQT